MAATSSTSTTSSSSNGEIWRELDPEFYKIKCEEDELRTLYALPSSDPSRPDIADPLYNLVEIKEEDLPTLRQQMKDSYQTLQKEEDVQMRKFWDPSFDPTESDNRRGVLRLNFALDFMDGLPDDLKPHLMLGGGAVLKYIMNEGQDWNDDLDLFVVNSSSKTVDPKVILRKFLDLCMKNTIPLAYRVTEYQVCRSTDVIFCRSTDAVTIKAPYTDSTPVQIILRHYVSPSQVLAGFDLDASGVGYYNGKLYATKRALHSLHKMILHVDIDRMSPSYNYRLVKYMRYKHFAIHVPTPITAGMLSRAWNITARLQSIKRFKRFKMFDRYRNIQVSDWYRRGEIIRKSCNSNLVGLLIQEFYIGRKMNRRKLNMEISDYSGESTTKKLSAEKRGPEDEILSEIRTPEEILGVEQMPGDLTNTMLLDFKHYYSAELKKHTGLAYAVQRNRNIYILRFEITEPKHLDALFDFPYMEYLKYWMMSWGGDQVWNGTCAVPRRLTFRTDNPGSQFTGTFHPISMTWEDWTSMPSIQFD